MDIEDLYSNLPLRKSQIISCSRRTDIPAFYMNDMLQNIKNGYVIIPLAHCARSRNTPTGQLSKVSLLPIDVIGFVWWSKDYSNWIKIYNENIDLFSQYTHMFNFTINSRSSLEPNIKSSLDERLGQLKYLTETFTPKAIKYRFDPIVFYTENDKPDKVLNNLGDFEYIVKFISECGLTEMIFSFCLPYQNVKENMNKSGKNLITLTPKKKVEITKMLIGIAEKYNVKMCCCSEPDLVEIKELHSSCCVDGFAMEELSGRTIKNKKKDSGQRKQCNCTQSRDIGRYDWVCSHKCAYCYANPDI